MPDIARDIPSVPSYDGTDDYQRDLGIYIEQVADDLRRDLGIVNDNVASPFGSDVTILGSLEVDGDLDVSGAAAFGTVTLGSDVTILGSLEVDGDLDVSGAAAFGTVTLGSDVTIGGSLEVDGTLDISRAANFGGDVTFAGAIEIDGTVDISGNVAMDGDLTVDGKFVVDNSSDFSTIVVTGEVSGSVAVFSIFGDLTTTAQSVCGETIAIADTTGDFEHIFCASTDAFVSASITGENLLLAFIWDNSAGAGGEAPTQASGNPGGGVYSWAFMPVKKGEYWGFASAIPNTDAEVFHFRPIGLW